MKLHWYSMAFMVGSPKCKISSGYFPLHERKISASIIKEAKRELGIAEDSVMLSCCYLGEMTEKEFKQG